MTGQDFSGARRVMVVIEMPDGNVHGWEVGTPQTVRWDFAGSVMGSTYATITVTGEFYRTGRTIAPEEQPPLYSDQYQGELEA